MKIISRAPVRIDFGGGGSDVPPFCERHGGAVASAAINKYVTVTLESAPVAGGIVLRSADGEEVAAHRAADLPAAGGALALPAACVRRLPPPEGLRLTVRSDVPSGSGLGASSALAVAALSGLARLRDQKLPPDELARLAYQVERVDLGCAGGWQDQCAAAFGGLRFWRFEGSGIGGDVLPLDGCVAAALQERLVLAFTGAARVSSRIVAGIQAANLDAGSPSLVRLQRLTAIARAQRDACLRGDVEEFACLIDESGQVFVALEPASMNPGYAAFFAAARAAGATAAKPCGAGGGGCLVAWCEEGARESVRQALVALGGTIIDFSFERRGAWALEQDGRPDRRDPAGGLGQRERAQATAPPSLQPDDALNLALGMARAGCRCEDDAQDVAGEAMLRFYGQYAAARPIRSACALLRQIVRHLLADRARVDSRRAGEWHSLDEPGISESVADAGANDPLEQALRHEAADRLRTAVEGLRPAEREAVEAVYGRSLPAEEAAALLGITRRALDKRLERARRDVRLAMGGRA